MSDSCLELNIDDMQLHPVKDCECDCDSGDRHYFNSWSYLCYRCDHLHKFTQEEHK